VVEAPYGCLPHECYGVYEPDFNHMDAYVKLMMGRAVEGVKEYLEKYIYSPKTFDEYLELFKTQDIIRATLNARRGHGA
jgi:glutaconate CoA-transferase subunit A